MIKIIMFIFVLLFFNGCAPTVETLKMAEIDKNHKTIYIPGNGKFYSHLRYRFTQNNWKVTTQYGSKNTQGTIKGNGINLEHTTNYSTRYTLRCAYGTYWDFGTKYLVDCTTLDNIKGTEVLNLAVRRGEFEMYNLQQVTTLIVNSLEKNK